MRLLTVTLLLTLFTSSAFASLDKKQVKIRIQSSTGNLDEATMYFDQGISPTYNYQEDAQKVFSGVAGVPVIYSVTSDNIQCSINGFGTLSNTEVVPLGVEVDANGVYTLTASLLDNFDPTSIIRLEDRQLGVFTDLRTNFYQAQLDASDPVTGRFFIHASFPTVVSNVSAGCANDDGKLLLNSDNSVVWDECQLFDANHTLIAVKNNVTGSFDFRLLPEGDYFVNYVFGSYSTTQTYHVSGNAVVADISATAVNVATFEDITFSAVATHTNKYEWDFGDGTMVVGVAHPTLSYYTPGVYTVNLKCSNDIGCYDVAQITVTVSLASGVEEVKTNEVVVGAQGKTVMVELASNPAKDIEMQVYNLIGQSVYSNSITAQKTMVNLNSLANGYYLVAVKNGDKPTTKRIFLGE